MNNIVIKANNNGVMLAIANFLSELSIKAYFCKWMTIDFEQLTFTMNGVDMSYNRALELMKGIEALSWVKQYHSGYFTSHSSALTQYHEVEKQRQMEQDEASFEHAAKEAGHDVVKGIGLEEYNEELFKDVYKENLTFPKSWMRKREDED